MKKVTIMIPTYNQAQYIEQCIESALDQDYSNIEVIISDDSTNDLTEAIIKQKYLKDTRIKYFHNTPPLGRVGNYRKMLYDFATGDYVLNLDGDDWLIETTYISKAARILEQHDNVVCVTANILIFDESKEEFITLSNTFNRTLSPIMKGSDYLYEYSKGSVSFSHMTTLYRREAATKIGFYSKDIIFSDGESIFRLLSDSNLAFIDSDIGVWRQHTSNASNDNFIDIDLESAFSLEESIAQACEGQMFGPLSVNDWAKKLKLNNLYSTTESNLKQFNIRYISKLMMALWQYDRRLFLQFLSFAFRLSTNRIKNKLKILWT